MTRRTAQFDVPTLSKTPSNWLAAAIALTCALAWVVPASAAGPTKKTTAAAPTKAAAPAKPAAKPATPGTHPGAANTTNHGTTSSATHSAGTVHNSNGTTTTHTAKGAEITKSPSGKVTSVKTADGTEAKFGSNGQVKEVRTRDTVVTHGPNGIRRTEVERPDHTRLVAEGHGRGYIQHTYVYGGHSYYARTYYYGGGYYPAYYRGYYYNGIFLNAYMPAYYYPPVYYGWAYNPWPAPVPYAWGWAGNPWYGYYGAYFQPYPVYPSAAFWIADFLVAASLREAYVAAAASASLDHINPAHLVFASYDPDTGTTSPTMTKDVKDAVAEEIKLELALQKTQGDSDTSNAASLSTLLADNKPHVFVASSAINVTSSGQDCGLTQGDVIALNAPPAAGSATADLRVLASKQTDCPKGNVITVQMTDLQDMHNNLLSNIDKGMAQMKDHPGQGGLPAPPAEAISGTRQAPYAAAAPAADPNGAAELDQTAKQGAEVEQQVVAETATEDGASPAASPIGGVAAPAAAPAHTGPVTIALGQTPADVIAAKGQPTNKIQFPTKVVYVYPDMKIIFVKGKVSDVQ
jgi:hypothetical protein